MLIGRSGHFFMDTNLVTSYTVSINSYIQGKQKKIFGGALIMTSTQLTKKVRYSRHRPTISQA